LAVARNSDSVAVRVASVFRLERGAWKLVSSARRSDRDASPGGVGNRTIAIRALIVVRKKLATGGFRNENVEVVEKGWDCGKSRRPLAFDLASWQNTGKRATPTSHAAADSNSFLARTTFS
jgi:hypothetical protein